MRRVTTAVVIGWSLAAVATGVASTARADTGATTITINVSGCEGCVIQALQFDITSSKTYQSHATTVTNGIATIGVPTSKTKGMYFSITTAKPLRIDALPLIAVQYKGLAPGTSVTKAKAKASKQASACWAGTTSGTATLEVTVKRIIMASFPNAKMKVSVPLAFFQPSVKAYSGFGQAFKGLIATQDVWSCGPGSAKYH